MRSLIVAITFVLITSTAALAQGTPPPEIRAIAGLTTFLDEDADHHVVLGGAGRYYLTSRLSLEPEILYMIGSGSDRDVSIVPHVAWDFNPGQRVRPYVIGGVGLLHHRQRFGPFKFTDNEWTVDGGIGVKFFLNTRVFVAPEIRLGFEPLLRVAGSIGFTF